MNLTYTNELLFGEFNSVEYWISHSEKFWDDHQLGFGLCVALYLPAIFSIQHWMKDRKAWNLKWPLTIWNFSICIFSLFGALYTISPLVSHPTQHGISDSICGLWCYSLGKPSQWIFFFNLSKIAEFVDTVFIVLRKRPLIFLHYYHHVVTMLFCWYLNQHGHYIGCNGFYFASVNYIVHTFMYAYYGFRSLGLNPGFEMMVTISQISQMIFGIVILLISLTCERKDLFGIYSGLAMYFSFFILFLQLFAGKYTQNPKKGITKKTE